jgi:hypothetical protein
MTLLHAVGPSKFKEEFHAILAGTLMVCHVPNITGSLVTTIKLPFETYILCGCHLIYNSVGTLYHLTTVSCLFLWLVYHINVTHSANHPQTQHRLVARSDKHEFSDKIGTL